jgi:uncharacterized membrane protein YgdD (TMEM256/DUF423 family)
VDVDRLFLGLGAGAAFLAVATGAFGAHALGAHFEAHPDLEGTYHTAVQYLFYHAVGLLVIAWAVTRFQTQTVAIAGYLFVAGIVLFSGSLFALSLTGVRWWGAVTPFGGLAFLSGWALLALAAWRG